jgi:hypothetical protein
LALVVPLHTLGLLPNVIVGRAFTVTLITLPVLLQPVVLLVTVNVPLYVPAPGLDGTVILIGLAGKEVVLTFVNPAMIPAAPHAKLYWLGEFVVAE